MWLKPAISSLSLLPGHTTRLNPQAPLQLDGPTWVLVHGMWPQMSLLDLTPENLTYFVVHLLLACHKWICKLGSHVLKLQSNKMEGTWVPESLPRRKYLRDAISGLWELEKIILFSTYNKYIFKLCFFSVDDITLTNSEAKLTFFWQISWSDISTTQFFGLNYLC